MTRISLLPCFLSLTLTLTETLTEKIQVVLPKTDNVSVLKPLSLSPQNEKSLSLVTYKVNILLVANIVSECTKLAAKLFFNDPHVTHKICLKTHS